MKKIIPFAILAVGFFILTFSLGEDYSVYRGAVHGYAHAGGYYFYYPYFSLFFFAPFALVSPTLGYIAWSALNFVGILYANRVFSGRYGLAFASLHFMMGINSGQVVGVVCAGLAFTYQMLETRHYYLAGLGATVALTKFHWCGIILAVMVLYSSVGWRAWLQIALAPLLAMLVSLAIWGDWVAVLYIRLHQHPVVGYVWLWREIGPITLVLWIPVLLLRMDLKRRLILAGCCIQLATPYAGEGDFNFVWAFYHTLPLVSWAELAIYPVTSIEVHALFACAVLGLYCYQLLPLFPRGSTIPEEARAID
jgi:hypothetical protein